MSKEKSFLTNIKQCIENKTSFKMQDIAETSNIIGISSFLITTAFMKRFPTNHPPKKFMDYLTKLGLSVSWAGWSTSSTIKSIDRLEENNEASISNPFSYAAISTGLFSIFSIIAPRVLHYSPINCVARKASLSALILDGTAQNIKEFDTSSTTNTIAVFSSLISKEPKVMLFHKQAGEFLGKAASCGWSAAGIINSAEQINKNNLSWTSTISATTGFMCYHSIMRRNNVTPVEYNHLSLSLTSLLTRAIESRSYRLYSKESNSISK